LTVEILVSGISQDEEEFLGIIMSKILIGGNETLLGQVDKDLSTVLSLTVTKVDEVPLGVLSLMLQILNDVGISFSNHVLVGVCGCVIELILMGEKCQYSISHSLEVEILWLVIDSESESQVPVCDIVA
jgi:hypothetical protein